MADDRSKSNDERSESDEDDRAELFAADLFEKYGGMPPGPTKVVIALVGKAKRWNAFDSIPLEQLLAPEALPWLEELEQQLDQLGSRLEGFGIHLEPRYRSPSWAEVLLVADVANLPKGQILVYVEGLSVYVKFVDELGEWRVYKVDRPDLSVDELP